MKGAIYELERHEVTVDPKKIRQSFLLQKAMQAAGICPFSKDSLSQYEKELRWLHTPRTVKSMIVREYLYRVCWAATLIWSYFAIACVLLFGIAAIPLCWYIFPIACVLVALLCYPSAIKRQPWIGWNVVLLETYVADNKYPLLPGRVCAMANQLMEYCPNAILTVWIFEADNASFERLMHVGYGNVGYMVEKWRE